MEKITFNTIKEPFQYEIPKIKGSRFLTYLFPVKTKEDCDTLLEQIKKEHYNATHHCSAWRYQVFLHEDLFGGMMIESKFQKANDDGEPSNTAGKPILTVLQGGKIHNTMAIVVRYFGGTLLGVGGLIQAYTQATKEALEHAPLIQEELLKEGILHYGYEQTALISYLMAKYEIHILSTEYQETSHPILQKIALNQGFVTAFSQELYDKSKGQLRFL